MIDFSSKRVPQLALACAAALLLACAPARAHDPSKGGVHEHKVAIETKVTVADYRVPDVRLVRDDGKKVQLASELDDGRPVILNFIYTTCPGICPVMSAVFSEFQGKLGADREKVHMVSISIDPEQDTPPRLRAYAAKWSAGRQWQHYTGTVEASIQVQKAFDAYRGDKMSHDPLTLMRPAPGKPWMRIDGFTTPDDLLAKYIGLAAFCEQKTAAR
jgi:protein SCO1/2